MYYYLGAYLRSRYAKNVEKALPLCPLKRRAFVYLHLSAICGSGTTLCLLVDVIGICKKAEDVSRITTKNSREVSKRALHLIDSSGKEVTATLWGEEVRRRISPSHIYVHRNLSHLCRCVYWWLMGMGLPEFHSLNLTSWYHSVDLQKTRNPDLRQRAK